MPTFSRDLLMSGKVGEEAAALPTVKKSDAGEVPPFVLSKALPVVPAKLVKRILKGEFVNMVELLKDNMEIERRCVVAEGESSQGLLGPRGTRREVPDILSWLQSFSAYAAVLCSQYPAKARELWAY